MDIAVRRISFTRAHEYQPGGRRLVHHPFERLVGRRVVRVTAADVGMHAGEPYLTDPLRIFRPYFVPKKRMKRVALVVERHRMPSGPDALVERVIRHRQRPDPFVDAAGQFRDRRPIGRHRIPRADEFDGKPVAVLLRLDVLFSAYRPRGCCAAASTRDSNRARCVGSRPDRRSG